MATSRHCHDNKYRNDNERTLIVAMSGLPLVLIHGRDSSKETFSTLLKPLSERMSNVLVCCVNLPGHGTDILSDRNAAYASEEAFVDAVDRRISLALGSDSVQYALLGHSMGARAAVLIAKHRRARVAALVIEDMSMNARGSVRWSDEALASFSGPFHRDWSSVRAALAPFGYDDAWLERKRDGGMIHRVKDVDSLRLPFLTSSDDAAPPSESGALWFLGTDPRVTKLAHELLLSPDHHELMEQLAASGLPMFAILAEQRRSACDPSQIDVLKRQCRSVITIAGAGHSIHATHRDEFIDAVVSALNTNE
jgi:pimeloyl-ACP methyl ester carboxylesterase